MPHLHDVNDHLSLHIHMKRCRVNAALVFIHSSLCTCICKITCNVTILVKMYWKITGVEILDVWQCLCFSDPLWKTRRWIEYKINERTVYWKWISHIHDWSSLAWRVPSYTPFTLHIQNGSYHSRTVSKDSVNGSVSFWNRSTRTVRLAIPKGFRNRSCCSVNAIVRGNGSNVLVERCF